MRGGFSPRVVDTIGVRSPRRVWPVPRPRATGVGPNVERNREDKDGEAYG